MPCSPGSRVPSGLPRPCESRRHPRRLTRMPHPPRLGRSDDGQDHTVLPYARPAIFAATFPALSTKPETYWRDEPFSAARPRAASGSRRAIRPAQNLSRTTLPRPPQARLANMTTTRSPLKIKPGCAIHTPFPNFGQSEYFCRNGLTARRNRGVSRPGPTLLPSLFMEVHSWRRVRSACFEPPVRSLKHGSSARSQRSWPALGTALTDRSGHQPVLTLCPMQRK
jgi:hypothetical protein